MNSVIAATAGDGATVRFPLRVAALDMGSNAIRFAMAEYSDIDHQIELESKRFAVRLGLDAFTSGVLSPASLAGAVAAAVSFRMRLDDLGIAHYRAVATSAVRESRNGGELVDRIRQESGIHLETITGSEEARLVFVAIRQRIPLQGKSWIMADLGGGSIEVSMIEGDEVGSSVSEPLGTVRLLADLPTEESAPERYPGLLNRYASRLQLPERLRQEVEGIIITGGNAEALGDLAKPGAPSGDVTEISRATLRELVARLSGMTNRQRIDELGLREDRADVIVPAAILFDRVAELSGSNRILIPRVGVKDGLLLDIVLDRVEHREYESELDRVMRAGAIALGRRHRFDEAHARHVTGLALSLFDQLAPVHGLGETSRRRLEAGALLHDIGQAISYRGHHKHSWYLVSNSEIPGLSAKDVAIVALIARYHRRSEPKEEHAGYAELKDAERAEVNRLAAIVRIADALDREHDRRVESVEVRVKGGRVRLRLAPGGDTELEQWALKKKSALFEKIYDLDLQVG